MQLDLVLLRKQYNEHKAKYGLFNSRREDLITYKGTEYRAVIYPEVFYTKTFRDNRTGEEVACKYMG